MRLWDDTTPDAVKAKDMLIESCRVTADDAQKAISEALVHVIITRRLRTLKRNVRLAKEEVCKLLTDSPKQISLY